MSLYNDASLVLIPSGFKTSVLFSQKPTDGSGDLSFTRALQTATRVGSDGLIEKVRTNLLLQSNGFDNAAWTKTAVTVTSGQAGYDGTNNAWLLNDNAVNGSHDVRQIVSLSGSLTCSVFAKAGTISFLKLSNGINVAFFNLSTGVVGVGGGVMTSVGGGWYRCSIASSGTSSLVLIGMTNADNTLNYAGDGTGTIFIQNSQLELSDIATPYIPTTTAAVSVGMLANVPRLDYLGGGCPKLLLEPQRSNIFNFSEQPDNAYWSKIGSLTITPNTSISPEGFQNADLVTGAGGSARLQRAFSGLTAGTRTLSFFAKAGTGAEVTINTFDGIVDKGAGFNLTTGLVTFTSAGVTATITDYGNDWYRLTHTFTSAGTSYSCQFYFDDGLNYQVWGFQFEDLAAFATSYIPTLGAAVTRSADAASKTGISALIGQTEGTIFGEFANPAQAANGRYFSLSDGTAGDRIDVYAASPTSIGIFAAKSFGVVINTTFAVPANAPLKYAIAYKAGDYAWYLNGVQIGTSANTNVPIMSVALLSTDPGGGIAAEGNPALQALLFKTRLTNAQLAELTA